MRKNNGFGLLELLVAIGVMAVISAIATPSVLTWRAKVKLRSATEQFRGALQLAKSRAQRDGQTVIVKIAADKYFIFVDRGDGGGGPANGKYDSHEPVVYDQQLPAGVRLKLGARTNPSYDSVIGRPMVENQGAATRHRPVSMAGTVRNPDSGEKRKADRDAAAAARPNAQQAVPETPAKKDLKGSPAESQPPVMSSELGFDHTGRCINPQSIVVENSRGKKRLVAVNRLGNVKVISID